MDGFWMLLIFTTSAWTRTMIPTRVSEEGYANGFKEHIRSRGGEAQEHLTSPARC